jgi:hypothetical protein
VLDLQVVLFLARGEWLLVRGDAQSARNTVTELLQEMGDRYDVLYTPALLSFAVRVEAEVAEGAKAGGQSNVVAEAARRAGDLLARLRGLAAGAATASESLALFEAHLATAAAELAGLQEGADAEAWSRAAARWLELGHRPSFAYARLMEAKALLRLRGAVPAVSDLLRQAYVAADAMGARPLLERAEACAAAAGISASPAPA